MVVDGATNGYQQHDCPRNAIRRNNHSHNNMKYKYLYEVSEASVVVTQWVRKTNEDKGGWCWKWWATVTQQKPKKSYFFGSTWFCSSWTSPSNQKGWVRTFWVVQSRNDEWRWIKFPNKYRERVPKHISRVSCETQKVRTSIHQPAIVVATIPYGMSFVNDLYQFLRRRQRIPVRRYRVACRSSLGTYPLQRK